MNIKRERKKLFRLHMEYQSLVNFFTFASKEAKSSEDKGKIQFHLSICKGMVVIVQLLLHILEEKEGEKV